MSPELINRFNELRYENANNPTMLKKINAIYESLMMIKRNKFILYSRYFLGWLMSLAVIVFFVAITKGAITPKFIDVQIFKLTEVIMGQSFDNWYIRTHYTADEARNMEHRGEIVPKINMTREERRLANVYNHDMYMKARNIKGALYWVLYGLIAAIPLLLTYVFVFRYIKSNPIKNNLNQR